MIEGYSAVDKPFVSLLLMLSVEILFIGVYIKGERNEKIVFQSYFEKGDSIKRPFQT